MPEDLVAPAEPLLQRSWVRLVAFSLACVAGMSLAVALAFFNNWRERELAELAHQRLCLDVFLHSAEFADFVRTADDQLVATINYVTVQPQDARATIPAVAAIETARGEVPWTFLVAPLPVSAGMHPARVVDALRNIEALLASRGFAVAEAERAGARQTFLRMLQPYAKAFHARVPESSFAALILERSMQEAALAGYARHFDAAVSVAETERLLDFYGRVGPAMWRAIEREHDAAAKMSFVMSAR